MDMFEELAAEVFSSPERYEQDTIDAAALNYFGTNRWRLQRVVPFLSSDALVELVKKMPITMLRDVPTIIPQKAFDFCFKHYPFTTTMSIGHFFQEGFLKRALKKFPYITYEKGKVKRNRKKLSHKEELDPLTFKLGIIEDQGIGRYMSFEEANAYISNVTLMNLEVLAQRLNVTWHTVYFFHIDRSVQRKHYSRESYAWSNTIVGNDNDGDTLVYMRRETRNPAAGQTKLYFEGHAPIMAAAFLGEYGMSIKEWKEKGKRLKKRREEKKNGS